jgi:hypothetical protein
MGWAKILVADSLLTVAGSLPIVPPVEIDRRYREVGLSTRFFVPQKGRGAAGKRQLNN